MCLCEVGTTYHASFFFVHTYYAYEWALASNASLFSSKCFTRLAYSDEVTPTIGIINSEIIDKRHENTIMK